jgi:hypothetical protein
MTRRRPGDHESDFPPDLIDADEAIDLVIDAVLVGSKPLRRMTKAVLKQEKKLRRGVDADAWKLLNERASKQMDVLVRWALARRARSRR